MNLNVWINAIKNYKMLVSFSWELSNLKNKVFKLTKNLIWDWYKKSWKVKTKMESEDQSWKEFTKKWILLGWKAIRTNNYEINW